MQICASPAVQRSGGTSSDRSHRYGSDWRQASAQTRDSSAHSVRKSICTKLLCPAVMYMPKILSLDRISISICGSRICKYVVRATVVRRNDDSEFTSTISSINNGKRIKHPQLQISQLHKTWANQKCAIYFAPELNLRSQRNATHDQFAINSHVPAHRELLARVRVPFAIRHSHIYAFILCSHI